MEIEGKSGHCLALREDKRLPGAEKENDLHWRLLSSKVFRTPRVEMPGQRRSATFSVEVSFFFLKSLSDLLLPKGGGEGFS